MRNTNKKGFTIVELAIVVAVIAILAAVLIPTFSGIIRRANLSADQKAVHDMNTALAIAGNPDNIDAAIDALIENGFNGDNLVPVSKDYLFVWHKTEHNIILIEASTFADSEHVNLAEVVVQYTDVAASTKEDIVNAIANGSEYIKFENDIAISEEIEIPAGQKVTLDLNGKTISSNVDGDYYPIYNSGELTIVGGTIENTVNPAIRNTGILTLENVTVKGNTSGVLSTGTVIINSGTFDGAVAVEAGEGNVVINGGTFTNSNDGSGQWGLPSAPISTIGANVEINGGTFTASEGTYVISAMLNGDIGTLEINGGTFVGGNGITFNGAIEISDGTFNCAIEAIGGLHVDGGTFSQQITINSWHSTDSSVDDRDVVISGGNFTYGDGQFIGDGSIDGNITGGTFNTTEEKLFVDNDFVYVDITGGSFKAE